jgi:hypothetical protein
MSLCLGAGTLALALSLDAAERGAAGNTGTAAAAPDPVRAQAREIFAHIVGIESSIGKGKVPLVAKYLADRFKAGGFADADIHILPLGETASLVVRYRGKGGGAKPIAFMAHMDVVTAKRSDWQRDPYRSSPPRSCGSRPRASCRRAISSSHSAATRRRRRPRHATS